MVYSMNVFFLHEDPITSAQQHCDKHVVKMVIEYAQMLSTNHRFLDGEMYLEKSTNTGRMIKRWRLDDERENHMYKVAHLNHPSTVWARENKQTYLWLYRCWQELCKEYTMRYGRMHETERKLKDWLCLVPDNMPDGIMCEPPPAMKKFPQCIVEDDSVASYRKYYIEAKSHFAKWTKRDIPSWYSA
jgi:hypothetical protein